MQDIPAAMPSPGQQQDPTVTDTLPSPSAMTQENDPQDAETQSKRPRKPRMVGQSAQLKYAYPYEEWIKVIKSFYVTVADIVKMKDHQTLYFIYLPETLPETTINIPRDRIMDAERFTKLVGLRHRFKKSSGAQKGLTLKGVHMGQFIRFQVCGKRKRTLDDNFQSIGEDDEYGDSGEKWYDLNKRGSLIGWNNCHIIDAANLLKLPKVYLPKTEEEDEVRAESEASSTCAQNE